MGKCCSKPNQEVETKEETQEVLLQEDPGGTMTGGTVIVRTPGRWGVTATTTNTSPSFKRTIITSGPALRPGTGATVTKTFHFSNNGTAKESISFRTEGGFEERIVTTGKSSQQGVKGRPNAKGKRVVSSGTAVINDGNKQAFFNIAPSVNTARRMRMRS